jgi:putative restriction endonuclease
MKIDATISVSMIDACHIIPFCKSFDDTITNGIALCPNLHRAFDRGLIGIDDNYRVVVFSKFKESSSSYSIQAFDKEEILLPREVKYYPSRENLQAHYRQHFQ